MAIRYAIQCRWPGHTTWQREPDSDTYQTREQATDAASRLEPTNDLGGALEYRVVEIHDDEGR